jgi:E3 ubiquitin-protein ligase DOA10
MKRMFRDKRGITPVLSNVLLMVIAVAGMSIAMTATYVITNNLHEIMGERFIVEDVWFKTGNTIAVYLRNVGKMAIEISAVYVNYISRSFSSLKLEVNKHSWLNITYTWSADSVYYINIVTRRGNQVANYYGASS